MVMILSWSFDVAKKKILRHNALIPNDILFTLLERFTAFKVWLIAVIIYFSFEIIVGFAMDYFYPGGLFISIRDKAEFLPYINAYIGLMPIIWAMYRWMPKITNDVIREIEKKELILTSEKTEKKFIPLSVMVQLAIQKKTIYILSIIAVIATSIIFFYFTIPLQTSSIGRPPFWIYKPASFIIYIFIFSSSCYVVFLMLIRQISTILAFSRYFKNPDSIKKIIPLHADDCGGFSGFGVITTRTVIVVILILVWSLGQAYFPLLEGKEPIWNSMIVIYLFYILFVPIILIAPVWNLHITMVRYKQKIINQLSNELASLTDKSLANLKDINISEFSQYIEKMKKVQELLILIDRDIPTWPISFSKVKKIGFISSLPFIFSIAMNFIDVINFVRDLQKSP